MAAKRITEDWNMTDRERDDLGQMEYIAKWVKNRKERNQKIAEVKAKEHSFRRFFEIQQIRWQYRKIVEDEAQQQ